jgi:hypothetical protein
VPIRRRVQDVGSSSGHILFYSAGVGCKSCRQHSRMKTALTGWATQRCPGPGVRLGHAMRQVHGLAFCAVCGGWATLGGRGVGVYGSSALGTPASEGRSSSAGWLVIPPSSRTCMAGKLGRTGPRRARLRLSRPPAARGGWPGSRPLPAAPLRAESGPMGPPRTRRRLSRPFGVSGGGWGFRQRPSLCL